jgi:hypothetical protein
MDAPVITLLTDFREADGYVAQMKGVILGINPAARLVDVSHAVPPQDVRRGAILLHQVWQAFAPGTIHVAIIDPGVGSARLPIGAELGGQRFILPDNGLLSLVAAEAAPDRVHALTESWFRRQPTSTTFHGRDIFAPAAAHWSLGRDLAEFGPPLAQPPGVLPFRQPQRTPNEIRGEVAWVDAFGNLITNIPEALLAGEDWARLVVEIGGEAIRGVGRYYAERPPGSLLALVGSMGDLEIAVNGGNAAATLRAQAGTEVRVRRSTGAAG